MILTSTSAGYILLVMLRIFVFNSNKSTDKYLSTTHLDCLCIYTNSFVNLFLWPGGYAWRYKLHINFFAQNDYMANNKRVAIGTHKVSKSTMSTILISCVKTFLQFLYILIYIISLLRFPI